MKWFLISLVIVAVAVFTGTWIFDGTAWLLEAVATGLRFLAKVFNWFGWSKGIV